MASVDLDQLYPQAVELVGRNSGIVTAKMIQRSLKITHARSVRILGQLCGQGVVTEPNQNGVSFMIK